MDPETKPEARVPPPPTFSGWVAMSLLVTLLVGLFVGGGTVAGLAELSPGGSFAPAGWLIGIGVAIAVFSVMLAIGTVRFKKQ